MTINTCLSIVKDQSIYCLQETHITAKDIHRERKRMEKRVCMSRNDKKARKAILML